MYANVCVCVQQTVSYMKTNLKDTHIGEMNDKFRQSIERKRYNIGMRRKKVSFLFLLVRPN